MARFHHATMTTAAQPAEVAPGQTRQGLSDDHSFRSVASAAAAAMQSGADSPTFGIATGIV